VTHKEFPKPQKLHSDKNKVTHNGRVKTIQISKHHKSNTSIQKTFHLSDKNDSGGPGQCIIVKSRK
jgi:hypothetical protein